jgi:hypothetical protein
MRSSGIVLATLLVAFGCAHGLAPPDSPPEGVIHGIVTYEGAWPPADSLHDIRFVAMRFVPTDTSDFLQLNRLIFSRQGLRRHVDADTFVVDQVPPGTFVYSGIAQKYGPALFAWRPLGLYEENGGVFQVRQRDTTRLHIHVNFGVRPAFPPQPL